MVDVKKTRRGKDETSAMRGQNFLSRLAEGGGAPVRVDTKGEDIQKLDLLVLCKYAPSRAEAYRKALRAEYAKWKGSQFVENSGTCDTFESEPAALCIKEDMTDVEIATAIRLAVGRGKPIIVRQS